MLHMATAEHAGMETEKLPHRERSELTEITSTPKASITSHHLQEQKFVPLLQSNCAPAKPPLPPPKARRNKKDDKKTTNLVP